MHGPGLTLSVPELTVAYATLRLPAPINGFRARPTIPIGCENAGQFPECAIGAQYPV